MQPTVNRIDETKQEFLGKRYYLCGHYFQRDGVRLHRVVWSHFNGEIPEGYHVHHKDHDKANNSPENLELVHGSEHMSHHHTGHSRRPPEHAYVLAAEWHKSEEGRDWHFQHYLNNRDKLHVKVERACSHCGKLHETTRQRTETTFCSNKCKSAYRRASGTDNVERKCVICDTDFSVNRYSKQVACSRECGKEVGKRKKRERAGQKGGCVLSGSS